MNDVQTEERLRSALSDEAADVHPDEAAGLDRIRHRSARIRVRRRALVAGVAVAVVAVGALSLPRLGDDSTDLEIVPPADDDTVPPTTAAPTTVSSQPPATPTTEVSPPPELVWPNAGTELFADPESAARSFVEEYVGVQDPPLGLFRSTLADGGDIDVYTRTENGQVRTDLVRSTVTLHQVGERWGVVSAHSDAIVVDNPAPFQTVGSPVVVDGRGRGFEALIVVTVRAAGMGAGEELAQSQALAGCCEALEPFHVELALDVPPSATGSLLLQNDTAGVGVPDFTVVPIRFGAGSGTGSQATDERTVEVFWVDANGTVQAADRTVRISEGVLHGAIQQLLFGPYSAERDAGLTSGLEPAAASASFTVTISDGVALVDFSVDLPSLSPNTSASAASDQFLRQLHATVFQFSTVTGAEYRVGGSCEAFWAWLQRSCTPVTRDDPGV